MLSNVRIGIISVRTVPEQKTAKKIATSNPGLPYFR